MNDPTDISNWRRLDARISTSGQPTEAQLAKISVLGVKHVINLALHSHEKALPDERAAVTALGMAYTHIPVAFDAPTEAHFRAFCDAMHAIGNAPVHVHCIVNARVTAFLYRWQQEVLGRSEKESRALMDSVWQPGGVWAKFIGDEASFDLPHRGPV